MHLGLVMECDYRESATQEEAFEEVFALMETAETLGLDGVWLAERHFAARGGPLDAFGAGIPSVASAPLIMASAIAARTKRLRVGIAVTVLPLYHPIRPGILVRLRELQTTFVTAHLPGRRKCGAGKHIAIAIPSKAVGQKAHGHVPSLEGAPQGFPDYSAGGSPHGEYDSGEQCGPGHHNEEWSSN